MLDVAVTGPSGRTARRLLDRLNGAEGVRRVVPIELPCPPQELRRSLDGTHAILHLGPPRTARSLLDVAASSGPACVVHRSSAAVYGAWADNRVPLTEDVGLRPNPGFTFAAEHAEAERLLGEWHDDHPAVRVAVLRPAPVVAPGRESWESSTLGRPSRLRGGDSIPPAQFLHVDDAAAAFEHALLHDLDGTFNVAPDGFVPGETVRELAGAGITLPLPEPFAGRAERLAWRLGWGGAPAAVAPYRAHPWVVANDRFRAAGWEPVYTNEEALVAARKGSWWRELSPKRRQEFALGASAAGAVVTGVVVTAAIRGRGGASSVSRRG